MPSRDTTRRRQTTREGQRRPAAQNRSRAEQGRARRPARTTRPEQRETQRPERRQTQRPRREGQGSAPTKRRISSIDGFRALAVASVFCYHLDVAWLPSGHLGVVMFLMLTGYLVTSSLLKRIRGGVGAIGHFWLNRLARIWPPMAVMVAFTVLACVAFDHVLLTKARPDVLPALGMFENISYILRDVSYFEQIGGPSPLTHLWYLGIDAQFCLVWPPLLLLCSAALPSRTTTRRLCLVLAAASAVAMGLLFNPDSGTTRVYYGPDTRAFAPFVGAWLALVMPLGRRPARDLRAFLEERRLLVELVGAVSLVALLVAMVLIPDTSPILYRGGMFAATLLSAFVLATLVLPGGLLSALFSLPPLTWLGSRSYGVYLWHYPLIQLFHAANNGTPWWKIALCVVLSLLLAELTHQLLERPLSDPELANRLVSSPNGSLLRSPAVIGGLVVLLVTIGDGVGLALIPEETLVPEEAIVSTGEAADKAMDLSDGAQPEPQVPQEDVPPAEAVLHAPAEEKSAGIYDPVLIGDSVPGDAEAYWRAACPDGLLDSYVGRRPDQALSVLDQYLEQGVVGKIVILQAFSNTPVSISELDHMINACGPDRTVYLVNVRIPESEETGINRTISEAVNNYDNVHLINWHALSEGQADWIYPDGEHLTPTGQPIYISMLVDAIDEQFESIGGTITRKGDATEGESSGLSVVVDNTADASAGEG